MCLINLETTTNMNWNTLKVHTFFTIIHIFRTQKPETVNIKCFNILNKHCTQQKPKYTSAQRQASVKFPEYRQNSLQYSDNTVLYRFRTPPPHDPEHDPQVTPATP